MGYLVLLFIGVCSLQAMEECSVPDSSEKTGDLLSLIRSGQVDAVQERLLQGVRPKSQIVDQGQESEHYLNRFATAAVALNNPSERFEILRLLLEHGVCPNHSVQFGEKTPKKMPILNFIIRNKNMSLQEILLLLVHGADVDEKDFLGRSPLEHAFYAVNVDAIRVLRLLGAPPLELSEDEPYREEIWLLLTDIEEYKRQWPEVCPAIQGEFDKLKEEKLSRRRKVDEKCSVDPGIPRRPRKGPRKDAQP